MQGKSCRCNKTIDTHSCFASCKIIMLRTMTDHIRVAWFLCVFQFAHKCCKIWKKINKKIIQIIAKKSFYTWRSWEMGIDGDGNMAVSTVSTPPLQAPLCCICSAFKMLTQPHIAVLVVQNFPTVQCARHLVFCRFCFAFIFLMTADWRPFIK